VGIAGAGLAGLAAAVTLVDRGHDVVVFEASDGVGGRVRTDAVDGYLLDRGFQILLTAYPVAQRILDMPGLDLRRFQAGSLVQIGNERVVVGDPIRRPGDLLETVKAPIGSPIDKARLLNWRRTVMSGTVDELWAKGECTTAARFSDLKFSDTFVETFLRPLFAGITLDPKLEVTSRFTDFVFRMLAEGYGAVPSHGMGQLGAQLAARLPEGSLRLSTPVTEVSPTHIGLDGERVDVDAVIVATDMSAAAQLVDTPDLGWNSVTTRWFSADAAPYTEPLLLLNGTGGGPINNVAVMSSVSPHYAPAGKHLIGVSAPGSDSDSANEDLVRTQLGQWFGSEVQDWDLLRTDVIRQAQPRQLPGEALPAKSRLDSEVFVAGDHRQNPSINGALQSGRRTARSVMEFVKSS
jgi:phytoene dehydrogenase-like protein